MRWKTKEGFQGVSGMTNTHYRHFELDESLSQGLFYAS